MVASADQQNFDVCLPNPSIMVEKIINSLQVKNNYGYLRPSLLATVIIGGLLTSYSLAFLALLLVILSSLFILWYVISRKGNWKRKSTGAMVEGTTYSLPFGDIPRMQANQNGYYLRDLHKHLGCPKVYRAWMGPEPTLLLAHPDAVKEFWKQHNEKAIEREVKFGWPLVMLMHEGVGFKSYDDRNRINKYFHGSFSATKIHLFEEHIEQTVHNYMNKFSTMCDQPSIDIYAELKYLTHDVSLYLFCGPAGNQYLEELHSIVDELEELMSITFNGTWINMAGVEWVLPSAYRLRNRIKIFRNRFKSVLLNIMKVYEQDDSVADQSSVLTRFMHDQSCQQCTISFDELMDTMIEGLLAPTEGSSATFTYTLILLAMNQHVQTKLRDQLQQLQNLTMTDLKHENYLEHILSECQRIQPIFMYNVPELASCDMIIDDVPIPKNSMVMLDVVSLNQNSDVWPNPLTFDPDRFQNLTDLQRKGLHGFGNGRSRRCLGEHMIKAMHKLLIAQFVHLYEIHLPEPNTVTIQRKRRPFIFVPEQCLRLVPIHHE